MRTCFIAFVSFLLGFKSDPNHIIRFTTSEIQLSAQATDALDTLANILLERKLDNMGVTIRNVACQDEYKKDPGIGWKRAMKIIDYLVTRGLRRDRMEYLDNAPDSPVDCINDAHGLSIEFGEYTCTDMIEKNSFAVEFANTNSLNLSLYKKKLDSLARLLLEKHEVIFVKLFNLPGPNAASGGNNGTTRALNFINYMVKKGVERTTFHYVDSTSSCSNFGSIKINSGLKILVVRK